ncbi:MAG: UDP-galactopyranose mutase [Halocynthiibacter sp.]|jgi:UDP-galactopyranose mutase
MPDARICIVGAGVTGATIARYLADIGIASHVFDSRNHVAGNCHTEWDAKAKCYHHVYGPHIFHTNTQEVIDWISRFTELVPYKHSVKSTTKGKVFSLPINLHTLNQFFGAAMSPNEAQAYLKGLADGSVDSDENFETRAVSLIGRNLYESFFEGYTRKQWGVEPSQIPSDILKRLPVRFNYDDNYFFHAFQGLPKAGYTEMVAAMLDHPLITVSLNSPKRFADLKDQYDKIFWSGPIEDVFDADEGYLPYRTLEFETSHVRGDTQGCPVMNFPDEDVSYTRSTQHNYFRSALETSEIEVSLMTYEYSKTWKPGDIQYYPVHLTGENDLLARYKARAAKIENLQLCGRLGQFKYMDMDVAIKGALDLVAASYPHSKA